jgi:hypothetical protein
MKDKRDSKNCIKESIKNVYYTDNSVAIQLVNFSDIFNIIIPFFFLYPILGQKSLDFSDFEVIANMVNNKEHLTLEGFN